MATTITTRVTGSLTPTNTVRVSGSPSDRLLDAVSHSLLLEGGMQVSGTDRLLLEGDMTDGDDVLILEGDARAIGGTATTRVAGP